MEDIQYCGALKSINESQRKGAISRRFTSKEGSLHFRRTFSKKYCDLYKLRKQVARDFDAISAQPHCQCTGFPIQHSLYFFIQRHLGIEIDRATLGKRPKGLLDDVK